MPTSNPWTNKRLLALFCGIACLALILSVIFEPIVARGMSNDHPVGLVLAQEAQHAVVNSNILNMRSGPGTNYTIVGRLRRGDRVEVIGRQSGWLQIVTPGINGGASWVAERNLLLEGLAVAAPTSSAASAAAAVSAPQDIDYRDEVFTWRWDGVSAMQGKDWYFDIQIYHATDANPYKIIVVEAKDTTQADDVYKYVRRARAECDSYWVVQIAVRTNGRFSKWVSPKSTRQPVGGTCRRAPEPGPNPVPTEDGNGGGNGCPEADCTALAPRLPAIARLRTQVEWLV